MQPSILLPSATREEADDDVFHGYPWAQAQAKKWAQKELGQGASCIVIGAEEGNGWLDATVKQLACDGLHIFGVFRSEANRRQIAHAIESACVQSDLRVQTLDTCMDVNRFLADLRVRQAKVQGVVCDLGDADDFLAQSHRLSRFVYRLTQMEYTPGAIVFGQSATARRQINDDYAEESLLEMIHDISGQQSLLNFVNIEEDNPEAVDLGAEIITWLMRNHDLDFARLLWMVRGARAWLQPLLKTRKLRSGYRWIEDAVTAGREDPE